MGNKTAPSPQAHVTMCTLSGAAGGACRAAGALFQRRRAAAAPAAAGAPAWGICIARHGRRLRYGCARDVPAAESRRRVLRRAVRSQLHRAGGPALARSSQQTAVAVAAGVAPRLHAACRRRRRRASSPESGAVGGSQAIGKQWQRPPQRCRLLLCRRRQLLPLALALLFLPLLRRPLFLVPGGSSGARKAVSHCVLVTADRQRSRHVLDDDAAPKQHLLGSCY